MSHSKSIHDISQQLGLTSRTLRHWEEKELFQSIRDPQSGWRTYSDEAICRIRLVLLLRELDISIKDVKTVLDTKDKNITLRIMEKQIEKFNRESDGIAKLRDMIYRCLSAIKSIKKTSHWIVDMEKTLAFQISSKQNFKSGWEDILMTNDTVLSGSVRIVTLPAMRVAVCNIISESPEDEALNKVISWAEKENLMGTARIFGFNTTPYTPDSNKYGWAACVTVPEVVLLPEYLEEKRLPGGLYASLNSTNEVYDSWQVLMRLLTENDDYIVDKGRPCLEEHIQSGEPKGKGNDFYLNLLEPVCKK